MTMPILGISLGSILLVGSLLYLVRVVRHPDVPERWRAVERIAVAWDRAGLGSGILTRGYYLMQVFLALLGASFLTAGADELGWLRFPGASWISLLLMLGSALTAGAAAIVARTGRPTKWVPPTYR